MELKSMFIIDALLYIIGIFFSVSLISVMVFMVVALKRYIREWIRISRRIKQMETTINFLKNGVAIAFYGILMIIGISLLYGMIKEVFKKLFNWRK